MLHAPRSLPSSGQPARVTARPPRAHSTFHTKTFDFQRICTNFLNNSRAQKLLENFNLLYYGTQRTTVCEKLLSIQLFTSCQLRELNVMCEMLWVMKILCLHNEWFLSCFNGEVEVCEKLKERGKRVVATRWRNSNERHHQRWVKPHLWILNGYYSIWIHDFQAWAEMCIVTNIFV